ncbi:ABC-2 type transport system ATP-binding protein [Fonticella tunisiensis]|uniref:ABC-2 type transport system ATP-binding protein n=2 Tax=Fonticella tunisiensis TaxID=1096341 RepID=A0A4R7KV90_9CLOT|nr:ABC-2 type transport system ATP-binding protein [Fonticella tunisiensis]
MIKVSCVSKTYKVPKKTYKRSLKNIIIKPYTEVYAVNNISFNIEEGEIVGFVGLNGAGKTTTIKMLSGILTPTNGEITVLGYIPYKERREYTKKISVLMGQRSILFYDIPVIESLKFYKDVYELDNNEFKDRLDYLSGKLNLSSLLHIPVRKLSLGQRMKCEIVASILHNPKVIFLDEPTLGLDIISKQEILEFFRYLNQNFKTTIFLTTHDISDIDRFCKRIIIIDKGKIIYDGDINTIKERDKFKIVEITHTNSFDANNLITCNEYNLISKEEYKSKIRVKKDKLNEFIDFVLHENDILDININTISLEDILNGIYERSEHD